MRENISHKDFVRNIFPDSLLTTSKRAIGLLVSFCLRGAKCSVDPGPAIRDLCVPNAALTDEKLRERA